jgi:hypothetical protein
MQLSNPEELFYCTAEDFNRLELLVMRRVIDTGYNSHRAGLLLKDCPPYLHVKWQRWWRAGWRQRSEEQRRRRP